MSYMSRVRAYRMVRQSSAGGTNPLPKCLAQVPPPRAPKPWHTQTVLNRAVELPSLPPAHPTALELRCWRRGGTRWAASPDSHPCPLPVSPMDSQDSFFQVPSPRLPPFHPCPRGPLSLTPPRTGSHQLQVTILQRR